MKLRVPVDGEPLDCAAAVATCDPAISLMNGGLRGEEVAVHPAEEAGTTMLVSAFLMRGIMCKWLRSIN